MSAGGGGQQPQQRLRPRNVSPAIGTKQGPMKATLPVAVLMRPSSGISPAAGSAGSPPRNNSSIKKTSPSSPSPSSCSSSSSENTNRLNETLKIQCNNRQQLSSPGDRTTSPEYLKQIGSQFSPLFKEKSKQPSSSAASCKSVHVAASAVVSVAAASGSSSSSLTSSSSHIRRTNSLDTLYLSAAPSWPTRGASGGDTNLYGGYCGRLMVDKATQTPEEWDEMDRRKGQHKKIVDGLEMKYIRQRLQRSSQINRGNNSPLIASSSSSQQQPSSSLRFSPVPASSSSSSQHHPQTNIISNVVIAASSFCPLNYNQGGLMSSGSPSNSHLHPGGQSHSFLNLSNSLTGSGGGGSAYSHPPGGGGGGTSSREINSSSSANPIPIPNIPKSLIPRMRSSVEGLNQEIEKLVLRGFYGGGDGEGDCDRMRDPTPDGHRAPIAKLLRTSTSQQGVVSNASNLSLVTVDTQTPSNCQQQHHHHHHQQQHLQQQQNSSTSDKQAWSIQSVSSSSSFIIGQIESGGSSGVNSRSHSLSPLTGPLIPGTNSRPSSADGRIKSASPEELDPCEDKLGASPQINKFLAREPPDGCEKIKLIEEPKQSFSEPFSGTSCINPSAFSGLTLRPSVNFVLMPSQSSAFHPLYKPFLPSSTTSNNHCVNSSSSSSGPSSSGRNPPLNNTGSRLSTAGGTTPPPAPSSQSPSNDRLQ